MKIAHFSIYFYPTNSESFWLIVFKSFCFPNTVSNNFWTPSERVPFNYFLSMEIIDFYNVILLCFDFFHCWPHWFDAAKDEVGLLGCKHTQKLFHVQFFICQNPMPFSTGLLPMTLSIPMSGSAMTRVAAHCPWTC